jgi:glutathione S-transferase
MAPMKLYMTPGSCSNGIHIILEELEEVFEVYVVNLPAGHHFAPNYVAINPKSTIPALVRSDGAVLTEVPAIAHWLGRAHSRANLWPLEVETETRLIKAMAYIVGTVHGQGFARIYSASAFSRNPIDHGMVRAQGRGIIEQGFAILDGTLATRPYLAGHFSVADPILLYVEFWADKTDIPLPETLARHYRLMPGRPAVQRVLREEAYNLVALGGPKSVPVTRTREPSWQK